MRGVLLEILARVAAPVEGKAQMYIDRLTRRLRVALPDETTLDIEHIGRRNQPNGYPGLDSNSLIAYDQLGTGTPDGTKFLRDDQVWAVPPGGGGTSDHQSLTHLAWNNSGHTGTANRVAGFDASGVATYYNGASIADLVLTTRGDLLYRDATASTRLPIGGTGHLLTSSGTDPQWSSQGDVRALLDLEVGVDVQAYDADLTALAGLGNGLPYRAAGTWSALSLTDLAVSGGGLQVTQARGLRETSGPTTLNMGSVSDGQVLKRSGSNIIGVSIAGSTVTDLLMLGKGDGHTGTVTFDGTTAVTGFSLASRVYTRNTTTDSLEYSTMTLDVSGGDVTVVTKGLPIKAQTVTGSGTGSFYFDFSGSAASGTSAGTGASPLTNAPYYGGGTGGAGRSSSGAANAGAAVTSGVVMGGLGGHGGATGAAAGGNAPTPSRSYTGYYGSLIDIGIAMSARLLGSPYSIYPLWGGVGGGGGAYAVVSGSGTSGAGGGGAGVQNLGFGSVTLNNVTLYIRADGGAGSSGAVTSAGDNAFGGGQGGSGGMNVLTVASITGTWYVQARGGNGGNGAGGVSNNFAGGDGGGGGRVVVFYSGTAPTTDVSGGTKGTSQGTPFAAAADGAAGTAVVVAL